MVLTFHIAETLAEGGLKKKNEVFFSQYASRHRNWLFSLWPWAMWVWAFDEKKAVRTWLPTWLGTCTLGHTAVGYILHLTPPYVFPFFSNPRDLTKHTSIMLSFKTSRYSHVLMRMRWWKPTVYAQTYVVCYSPERQQITLSISIDLDSPSK